MEKLNQKLLEALAQGHDAVLCGPAGCTQFANAAKQSLEAPLKPLPVFFAVSLWNAIRAAIKLRPGLVLAGSGLTAPMAWLAARLSGAKFTVYLHGLDVIAPSRMYQTIWLPFIRRADTVLVNSRNTAMLAQSKGVKSRRIRVLHPGTDVPELDAESRQRFRSAFGLGDRPVLLSVGRLTRRKGLAEFTRLSLPRIARERPGACLVIVGGEATDALHGTNGSEQDRITRAARAAGVADSVRFVGRLDGPTLADAYQSADLHIFPVLDEPGDVEGFGMVALEAAALGLRTVAFRVGGVPDAISEPASGKTLAAGDYEGMAAAAVAMLANLPSKQQIEDSRSFARGLDWTAFNANFARIFAP